jgi:hypothetical protein
VHGETSTGVVADLAAMRSVADELGALLIADCVTTLGGMPLEIDAWGVDGAYAGTQKCLAAPCGLAPVTLSERGLERLAARTAPVQSWYLDLALVRSYWGQDRAYHHTAPIQNVYALHEALRLLLDEGLEVRWRRHALHARALWAGLEALGLALLVPEAERLVPLTAVCVPEGIDEARVRRHLLEHYSLEIGGGLGALKGRIWRIGLMGAGSKRANVELVLGALRAGLAEQGWRAKDDPLPAVHALYAGASEPLAAARADVCVPISRLAECILDTKRDLQASRAFAPLVGHAGDGNFHLNFVFNPDDPAEFAEVKALNSRLVRRALAMGGTSTGEHGVGLGKIDYLAEEHGEAVEVMKAIKRALDPENRMNPGKVVRI